MGYRVMICSAALFAVQDCLGPDSDTMEKGVINIENGINR